MPYFPIVIISCFAVFYHRAAKFEDESPFLWSGLSLLISVLTWFVLKWGVLVSVLGQVALFIGITAFRIFRKK